MHRIALFAVALCIASAPVLAGGLTSSAQSHPLAHITGIGGIFFKSKDPKALAAWYRDVLGIKVENWGGAALRTDMSDRPPVVVWGPFPTGSDYFSPSTREFMVNFAVDELDGFLAMLKTKGVAVLKRDDSDPNGSFAWIVDPDGTKIELWEPKNR
jgi:catechol 2,3-dioxygenase-like lactoylglutathione lyase family enzyme